MESCRYEYVMFQEYTLIKGKSMKFKHFEKVVYFSSNLSLFYAQFLYIQAKFCLQNNFRKTE